MTHEKYNGWTNRETWLVQLWGNPETQDDLDYIKESLGGQLDALPDGILKDMIDLTKVNWAELSEYLALDEEEDAI